jgi:hypothetical protein
MRNRMLPAIAFVIWSCGGSKPAPKPPEPVVEPTAEGDKPAPPPEQEPAPAPIPKELHAKAALQPVKGAKLQPITIDFTQVAGDDTKVTADIEGARPGKYQLVVHDGTECGPEGTKAGAVWKGMESVKLVVIVASDGRAMVDERGVKMMLGGVAPITGLVLALHEDKKGKPGKLLACGTIDAIGEGN